VKKFAEAMIDGFKKNNSDAEIAKYQEPLDELLALMKTFGKVKEGHHHQHEPGSLAPVCACWWAANKRAREIAGDDFYNTLLKIWLGKSPLTPI
jgi:hypothetical protein